MRLKEEQINRLSTRILNDLTEAGLLTLKKEHGTVLAGIRSAIASDLKAEETLEQDAERLMEENLRGMRDAANIDRHRMLRMIKERLAKERKIVL